MRIATWNLERLKHKNELDRMLFSCKQVNADILVLTETDSRICPNCPYSFHTPGLLAGGAIPYRPTENRVSIYSRYPCVQQFPTQ